MGFKPAVIDHFFYFAMLPFNIDKLHGWSSDNLIS
jgi:hypothetical protein